MDRSQSRRVAILGSTGSIGISSLDVISRLDGFTVHGLAARASTRVLVEQALRFRPKRVVVADERLCGAVGPKLARAGIQLLCGAEGLVRIASDPGTDIVIIALSGSEGVRATLAAIKAGKRVGLATKEVLVGFGSVVMAALKRSGAELLPIDSEHSAIHQCLAGKDPAMVNRIILTASGGPFLKRKNLASITPAQALRHPVWKMGKKITVDSATLMNKGLEVIETCWLFGIGAERVDIVIHPEGVIHSMVEFVDGSVIAQLARPDMKLPIQYALTFPERRPSPVPAPDFFRMSGLNFFRPDDKKFPCLGLAYRAARRGGSHPTVLNAANATAVGLFLERKIRFLDIPRIVEATLSAHAGIADPGFDELVDVERWAGEFAREVS